MASAAFNIDGGASLAKASVSATTSVALALDSTDGVDTVLWEIASTDDQQLPSDYTIVAPTATSTTVTSLGAGTAAIVRCTINGGTTVDANGNVVVGDMVKTAKFYVATAGGDEVICTGEQTESDATHGYAPIINALIKSGGGSGGGSGNVTAAASTTDGVMIVGDSTAKGIKDSPSGFADNGTGTLSRSGAAKLASVGATADATLEGGRDVILSPSLGNDTILATGGAPAMTFTLPVGGSQTIVSEATATSTTYQANDITIKSIAGDVELWAAGAGDDVLLNPGTSGSTILRSGSFQQLVFTLPNAGAHTIQHVGTLTSLVDNIAAHASGAGVPRSLLGQDGANGFVGGPLTIGGGAGGVPGTQLSGGVNIDLGLAVASNTAKFTWTANGVALCDAGQVSSRFLIDASAHSNQLYLSGTKVDVTAATSVLVLSAYSTMYLDSEVGDYRYRDGGTTLLLHTMQKDGTFSRVWDDGFTTDIADSFASAKTTNAKPSGFAWTAQDAYASATGANKVGGGFSYALGAGVSDGSYGDPAIEDGIITTTVNATNARREMVFRCTGTVTFSITPPGDGTFLYEIRYLTNGGAVIQRISAEMTTAGELTAIDTFVNDFGSIPIGAGAVATVDTTNDVLDIDVSDSGDGGGASDRKWTVWVQETRMGDDPTA